jgi:hypothetical protein
LSGAYFTNGSTIRNTHRYGHLRTLESAAIAEDIVEMLLFVDGFSKAALREYQDLLLRQLDGARSAFRRSLWCGDRSFGRWRRGSGPPSPESNAFR